MQKKEKLILIDGYSFVFRAYHSMPPLTRPDGLIVGALSGYANMLFKIRTQMQCDYLAVILDYGAKTFRNDLYDKYKANRPPAPEDLVPQFPLVRAFTEAMNMPTLDKEGFEADDIIATYVKQAKERGMEVSIISSDKDLMQLINDDVTMYDAMRNKTIGSKEVEEKFGVVPEKMVDMLAMMGDASDNIPGIPSIGPKTAAELLNRFGNLDEVLLHAEEITQNKRREAIIDNKELALLSRDLVKLEENVDLGFSIDDFYLAKPDMAKLGAFLKEQNFAALMSRAEKFFNKGEVKKTPETEVEIAPKAISKNDLPEQQEVTDLKTLSTIIEKLQNAEKIACYIEKSGAKTGNIITNFSFSDGTHRFAINFAVEENNDIFSDNKANKLSLADVLKTFEPILSDPSILKIAYDVKDFLHILDEVQLSDKLHSYDDVMVMSYILDNGKHSHNLPQITLANLEHAIDEEDNSHNAQFIYELHNVFKQRLVSEKSVTLYETIEKKFAEILFHMEKRGVKISDKALCILSEEFGSKIKILEKEIYHLADSEFNIGSPKQLGEILFEKMSLQAGKKSKKSGAFSTSVEILEELAANGHDIAEKILEWRHYSKLKSTYTDSLPKQINSKTGRVHSHFSNALTSTGRISSTNPNLQNIPTRSSEGDKIRQAFICDEGKVLISADYSQIELRLLAHIADIKSLQDDFAQGLDIHAATASKIFNVPLEQVDSVLRRRAKAINFGIIYGISAFGLARRLKIARSDAKAYIEAYLEKYSGIKHYMDQMIVECRENGYVETIMGRKCFFPNVNNKNPAMRAFTERAAINAPLQGSAADIIKKAMIKIEEVIATQNLSAKMILQVHDELIFEVKKEEAENLKTIIKENMENVIKLQVPLLVDIGVGSNWAAIH
jgi:DNA polymerase-1